MSVKFTTYEIKNATQDPQKIIVCRDPKLKMDNMHWNIFYFRYCNNINMFEIFNDIQVVETFFKMTVYHPCNFKSVMEYIFHVFYFRYMEAMLNFLLLPKRK